MPEVFQPNNWWKRLKKSLGHVLQSAVLIRSLNCKTRFRATPATGWRNVQMWQSAWRKRDWGTLWLHAAIRADGSSEVHMKLEVPCSGLRAARCSDVLWQEPEHSVPWHGLTCDQNGRKLDTEWHRSIYRDFPARKTYVSIVGLSPGFRPTTPMPNFEKDFKGLVSCYDSAIQNGSSLSHLLDYCNFTVTSHDLSKSWHRRIRNSENQIFASMIFYVNIEP